MLDFVDITPAESDNNLYHLVKMRSMCCNWRGLNLVSKIATRMHLIFLNQEEYYTVWGLQENISDGF